MPLLGKNECVLDIPFLSMMTFHNFVNACHAE